MRTLHTKVLKDGRVHILIELGPTEAMPVEPVKEHAHYRLGYPIEDVVAGHIIADARRVNWCSLEQKWIDA